MPKVVEEYKAQARARIVDAARAVFGRQGLARTTMDDIAREVGVSKGALYLYFRTKSEILIELQTQMRDKILSQWETLILEGDIAEGIARTIDHHFAGKTDPAVWHGLVSAAAGDPEVRAALALDRKADAKMMRRFLRRLEARGRIPRMRDPQALTDTVLFLMEGTVLGLMLGDPPANARRKLVRTLRLALGS
jgi:TetR/AcrR family transcriptional regulator, transcriptional repressor of aconitase